MSTNCEIFGLTYITNYGNNKGPLLEDFIHLNEYANGRLVDYVKAKVGYYLVFSFIINLDIQHPGLIGNSLLKLSNDCNEFGYGYGYEYGFDYDLPCSIPLSLWG